MTAAFSDTAAKSPALPSTESAPVPVRRRSFLRVSLGGALLFAAGAMVGFAPMRAWVFLRDDPKTVLISAIVVEADAKDVAGIREALSAHANDERTRNLDPLTILQSRPGTKTLAEPTLQTTVGESVTFFSGGEIVVTGVGSVNEMRRCGIEATFDPEIRPSGNIDLSYRISNTPTVTEYRSDDGIAHAVEIGVETIESKLVLRPGEWKAIEWNARAAPNPFRNRARWIFLRVEPAD